MVEVPTIFLNSFLREIIFVFVDNQFFANVLVRFASSICLFDFVRRLSFSCSGVASYGSVRCVTLNIVYWTVEYVKMSWIYFLLFNASPKMQVCFQWFLVFVVLLFSPLSVSFTNQLKRSIRWIIFALNSPLLPAKILFSSICQIAGLFINLMTRLMTEIMHSIQKLFEK